MSSQGVINVTWHYVHTGGLNLSRESVLYSLDTRPLRFLSPVGDDQLSSDGGGEVGEGGVLIWGCNHSSLLLDWLAAGNSYVFKVVSSNQVGSSSVTCPPIRHDIGEASGQSVAVHTHHSQSGPKLFVKGQFGLRLSV